MQHPFSMEFDEQEQLALFESILIEGFRTNHPHVYTGTITEFVRNKMGWETWSLVEFSSSQTPELDRSQFFGDDPCRWGGWLWGCLWGCVPDLHCSPKPGEKAPGLAPDLKLKKFWFQLLSSILMLQSTTLTLLIALLFAGVEPLGVWCVVLEFTCVVA